MAGAGAVTTTSTATAGAAARAGSRVPLGRLAAIEVVEGAAQISREQGMRRVVVEANVRGRDLDGFVREVQRELAPLARELPPGPFVEYGGQFENQRRALRQLAIVVPIALALIVLPVLYAAADERFPSKGE